MSDDMSDDMYYDGDKGHSDNSTRHRQKQRRRVKLLADEIATASASDIGRWLNEDRLDTSDPVTPVMVAAKRCKVSLLRLLAVGLGLSVTARDRKGRNILHHVALSHHSDERKVAVLVWLGALPGGVVSTLLDSPAANGRTPRAALADVWARAREELQLQALQADMTSAEAARAAALDEWRDKLSEAVDADTHEGFGMATASGSGAAVDDWANFWNESFSWESDTRPKSRHSRHARATTADASPPTPPPSAAAQRAQEAAQNSQRIIDEQLAVTAARQAAVAKQQATQYPEACCLFFVALKTPGTPLRLNQVPFPVPPGPLGNTEWDAAAVQRVVLHGVEPAVHLKALRLEQKKWHPDRWGAHLDRFPADARPHLTACIHSLSQTLNLLAAALVRQ